MLLSQQKNPFSHCSNRAPHPIRQRDSVRPVLVEDGIDESVALVDEALRWLSDAAAAAPLVKSSATSAAAAVPVIRAAPQQIQINMDNLLGERRTEDMYIRALLMVDGVTSVTLDRVSRGKR